MRWQTRYREMVVKTKRSTILPYWQPNNLACCIFMDASRKHKTLGSETKKLYYTWFCKQHDFHWHWFPFLPKSLKGNAEGLKEWSTCSGFGSQLRNPQIRKSKSFITGLKQTYLNSVPGEDVIHIILHSKQNYSLPQNGKLSLSSKALCCIHTIKEIALNKSFKCLCLQDVQKCTRSMENCLSTISAPFFSVPLSF